MMMMTTTIAILKSQLPKEPLTLFSVFLVALYNRVLDLPLAFRFFFKDSFRF